MSSYVAESKMIRIPVRIVGGDIKYLYGGKLPALDDLRIGELVIPEHVVKDQRFRSIVQMSNEVKILEKDSIIMVAVASRNIPTDKKVYCSKIETYIKTYYTFVQIKLIEPLKLNIRGSKKGKLVDVKCEIPSLSREADSLNKAYTIISESFEPKRGSRGGNVFNMCYYKEKELWHPLKDKRDELEGTYEGNLFLDYIKYKFNGEKYHYVGFDENEFKLIEYLIENDVIDGETIKELYNNQFEEYYYVMINLLDRKIISEVVE